MTETLQSGDVIGFSRGRTLSAMLEHLERLELDNLTATQLMEAGTIKRRHWRGQYRNAFQ